MNEPFLFYMKPLFDSLITDGLSLGKVNISDNRGVEIRILSLSQSVTKSILCPEFPKPQHPFPIAFNIGLLGNNKHNFVFAMEEVPALITRTPVVVETNTC